MSKKAESNKPGVDPGGEQDMEIPEDIAALGFEDAYRELEEVVTKLESGELSLEDSLEVYDRGIALSAHCDQLLSAAELRVKQVNDDGSVAGDLEV